MITSQTPSDIFQNTLTVWHLVIPQKKIHSRLCTAIAVESENEQFMRWSFNLVILLRVEVHQLPVTVRAVNKGEISRCERVLREPRNWTLRAANRRAGCRADNRRKARRLTERIEARILLFYNFRRLTGFWTHVDPFPGDESVWGTSILAMMKLGWKTPYERFRRTWKPIWSRRWVVSRYLGNISLFSSCSEWVWLKLMLSLYDLFHVLVELYQTKKVFKRP